MQILKRMTTVELFDGLVDENAFKKWFRLIGGSKWGQKVNFSRVAPRPKKSH
jgi:hypothetical protein